ncbi:TonB-dependent receptor [Herbaspirillum sp. WKF16]|uniref:TonB-dependent receptor n=1 Tax=Herbaspirillum sp. WKF16 TaxID=3028312 RepID=UPI0023A9184D|nr:TonB-dependent receptor [Herbaspirillum sp. WKF16]WDZ96230.1 TonB-dependent receptor [Herbaspirillum sp. WKF16]
MPSRKTIGRGRTRSISGIRLRRLSLAARLFCAGLPLTASVAMPAAAQESAVRAYDIPAGPLTPALNSFAQQSGTFLAGDALLTDGKRTKGLRGNYGVREALGLLLEGSGLGAAQRAGGGYVLRAQPAGAATADILPTVEVNAASEAPVAPVYAGGQVARRSSLGLLGQRDFMDTPFNVTSITADTIQNQQARTIGDVVKNDPSVRTIWPDVSYISQFTIRGFPTQTQDMAVNGLYGIVPPQMTGGLEAVERVEILKGPSALLNGMAPTGGVGGNINLVTKRATDKPITQFTASYYSDAQFGAHIDLGRRFGEDNSWGIRFNGAYRDGRTGVNDQSQRASSATVGIDYRNDRLRVSADLGYHEMRTDAPTRIVYTDNANFRIPAAPDNKLSLGQPWYFAKSNDTFGMIQGEFDLVPDLTVYAAAGARNNEFLGLYNFVYLQNASGAFRANQYFQPTFSNTKTATAGLKGKFDTGPIRHEFNLSATTLHTDSGVLAPVISTYNSNLYNPGSIAPQSLAPYASSAPKTSESDLDSLAIADTLGLLDQRLLLTLGARNQNVKVRNLSAVTGAQTSLYDRSKVTPAVGLVFKLAPSLSLYGNYIEGLSQGPTATAGTVNSGEVFAPIVAKQYEGGVKYDGGKLAATVGLFQIEQPSGIVNPATNVYGVDGEQRNQGLEINVFGEPGAGVRVLGGVTFIRGLMTKTAGGLNDGKKAVGVPTTQANLGGEWDVPFAPGFTLTGRIIYTSSQYYNVANTQSIPSWTRLDAGARYSTTISGKPVVIRAGIENLLDKNYWAAASSSFGLARGAPRTLIISTTFDF